MNNTIIPHKPQKTPRSLHHCGPFKSHRPTNKQPSSASNVHREPTVPFRPNRPWIRQSNTFVCIGTCIVHSNHQSSKGNRIQTNHHPEKHQTKPTLASYKTNHHSNQTDHPAVYTKQSIPPKSPHPIPPKSPHSFLPSILPNPTRAPTNTQYQCSLFSQSYSFKQRAYQFSKNNQQKNTKTKSRHNTRQATNSPPHTNQPIPDKVIDRTNKQSPTTRPHKPIACPPSTHPCRDFGFYIQSN